MIFGAELPRDQTRPTPRPSVSVRRRKPNFGESPFWIVAVTHNPEAKRGVLISLQWFYSLDTALRAMAEQSQEIADAKL
jgi:hypothetical protein